MSAASPVDRERPRLAALPEDPFELFADWFGRAEAAEEIRYAGAMCLSTVAADGSPRGRFVIVHPVDRGFVFLSDDRSPKADDLRSRPEAALTAYWGPPLELQVRIEGKVREAAAEVADAIFARRPRRSQTTPWASRQSAPASLDELTAEMARLDAEWQGRAALPRPEHWRGFELEPRRFEFWAARARRLHDRFRYDLDAEGGWERSRLAP